MSNQPPESQQVGAEAIVQDERPKAALIRWIDHFNLALMTVLALGLGVIACIAIAQVGARYIFRAPLAWSEEVIRFAMIWGVVVGTWSSVFVAAVVTKRLGVRRDSFDKSDPGKKGTQFTTGT